jgi:hypothetical protein
MDTTESIRAAREVLLQGLGRLFELGSRPTRMAVPHMVHQLDGTTAQYFRTFDPGDLPATWNRTPSELLAGPVSLQPMTSAQFNYLG